ncbi:hypothetical protein Xen7305DRAFT_00000440 [Xenococcus sp. PCC 7305]|uniref:hypothetical protein n=1 Tax=Xenococcus sp. PCC 7305 TaxID=102125 RepID=UPI0002ABB0B6|nr:hypothetical protein [Xenococcus sp. PCC 7305]ELS00344.1 hypothetical protein Xen7305DRAFT_00000440 [Xenococcus sp. PCC 7305]
MSQAILNQILDQLPDLEKSELQHLSQEIQGYLSDRETVTKRAAFHQALVESGLVRKIKKPAFAQKTDKQLIPIQGEPASQSIIEERR